MHVIYLLLLPGKNNIWKQLEKEAKELVFGLPSREVDDVVEKSDEDWFTKVIG